MVSAGSRVAFSSGYSMPSRVTPVAGPDRGKIETLSCCTPSTVLEPASIAKILPRSATTVERRPILSATSRICVTAKRAPSLPPTAQRRSASVAPRSLAASTARWPSILSFLTGWRSSKDPRLSTSRARSSPSESISPTTRSGTIPVSSAYLAPPSAATTRSACSEMCRMRPRESGDPFRKIAARTLGGRTPVVQLPRRRLGSFQRFQQHHCDHDSDSQARDQVRRVVRRRVEQRVPALRRVGGEEDHTRQEVAYEASQDGHRGAKDGALHCGLEESCQPQGAEGQGVVQEQLQRMYHVGIYGEIQQPVGRSRDDTHPPALPEGEEYEGDHLQGDGAAERHLEEHDESQDERQRYGERRLGQYSGVSEGIQTRTLLVVCGDAPLRDSEFSLRRHYPDQVQRVGTCVPSQPHGSPVFLTPSV